MATNEEVQKLAELSRIHIPTEHMLEFGKEFEGILGYVSSLETLTLDMDGESEPGTLRNVFREDGEPHETGLFTERIVAAFPEKEGDLLKVKQILAHE